MGDIVLIYDSKTGTTKKCSQMLEKRVKDKIDIINISENKNIDICGYKKVIIGSYINAGSISSAIKKFCKKNINTLLEKQVMLFICSVDTVTYKKYIDMNFGTKLVTHAIYAETFGGEFNLDNAKGFRKIMINSMINNFEKQGKELPKLLEENINRLANIINNF